MCRTSPRELIDGFLIEAAENLALVDVSLREFEQDNAKKQLLKDARRGVHTIKGAGGMVGLWALAKLAKRVEDTLDEVFDGEREWSAGVRQLILESHQELQAIVAEGGLGQGHEARLETLHAAYELLEPSAAEAETEAEAEAEAAAEAVPEPLEEDRAIVGELLDGFLLEAGRPVGGPGRAPGTARNSAGGPAARPHHQRRRWYGRVARSGADCPPHGRRA